MRGCSMVRAAALVAAALVCPAVVVGQALSAPAPAPSDAHAGDEPPSQEPQSRASKPPGQPPPTGLPVITDEDRKAAFPELEGQHTVHDDAVFTYVLFDQLEWRTGDGTTALNWDTTGWIGGDVNRIWFRTEGEASEGNLGAAEAQAFFGRAIARWWDLVVGVRHDARPGPGRTWAAVGIQGLAPYWFDVEATAYLGESGRTHVRLESQYEVLFTNRLILQPSAELEIYGKSDPEGGVSAGPSSIAAGLRLRYEIRREFAPYVGITWARKLFGTADLARAANDDTSGARLALGARLWF